MHSVPFQLSEHFAYPTTPRSQGVRISEGPLYVTDNRTLTERIMLTMSKFGHIQLTGVKSSVKTTIAVC